MAIRHGGIARTEVASLIRSIYKNVTTQQEVNVFMVPLTYLVMAVIIDRIDLLEKKKMIEIDGLFSQLWEQYPAYLFCNLILQSCIKPTCGRDRKYAISSD